MRGNWTTYLSKAFCSERMFTRVGGVELSQAAWCRGYQNGTVISEMGMRTGGGGNISRVIVIAV